MSADEGSGRAWIEHPDGPFDARCDAVVVGSGAGGAVAAEALATAGLSVVVLEEGGAVPVPAMRGEPLEAFRRMYRGRGLTATLGNVPIPLPMGRTLGGTTVVNSGTCFRAPAFVLRRWGEESGVADCSPGALDPLYAEVEAALGVAPVPEAHLGGNARRFRAGAEALGWAGGAIPRNARGCEASGVCVLGCPKGAKQDMKVAVLPRAAAAGARVVVGARVDRVLVRGGRAVGVEGLVLGPGDGAAGVHPLRVEARAVVLAAGAVFTPLLLKASGLALPWTGRNLRIHPSARVVARFAEVVDGHLAVPQGYHVRQFEEEGIFIQGMFLPPGVESPSVPGIGDEHGARMAAYRHLGSFGALVSDSGSGSVGTLPGLPGFPLLRYDLRDDDRRKLLRGIGLVARAFFAAGALEVYPPVHGHRVLTDPAGIDAMVAADPPADHLEPMAFHPMGTARMGRGPDDSVVDGYGRHHGVAGLRVADASLFPGSTHTNPQLTIWAFALRIGRDLARELATGPALSGAG